MYQSPRRLCSALLQRDASGLRRLPTPGLRRQSPPPAAAPRPASPRLLVAASAASGAARSCSRAGECTLLRGERRGSERGRRLETARNEWEVPGCWGVGQAEKRVLPSSLFRFLLALPILGLARPGRTGTLFGVPRDPWMRCLWHSAFLTSCYTCPFQGRKLTCVCFVCFTSYCARFCVKKSPQVIFLIMSLV